MKKHLFQILPLLGLLCSCEKGSDDYRYPSVITDFVCLSTDATGRLERLYTDKGASYPISLTDELLENYDNKEPLFQCDTVYRAIGIYELTATEQSDTVANIYSVGSVVSSSPTPLRDGEAMRQVPVYLQSCWCSGEYLNIIIEIKGLDMSRHTIGFVDTTPKGMLGREFTFYHSTTNDEEAYRQKLYASIPLAPFEDDLHQGGTLRFVVNTYDKGATVVEFAM